ncbi:diacylglycerol kinase family protein [Dysgonomonas sp. ZJ709]|uniref:diacylglycerol kinase family protein n=1 Tax=Dysgonomonas sp. ZJ709 TaxID=2709797 RepID=UPI0013EC59B9|nr:diacylglycerol kinase family protein [Dysgonomonas sp. ZJ709]
MEDFKSERFSVRKRLRSFRYAFDGLRILFREEHNARIHLVVSICVILMGVVFNISVAEWLAICILIGLVFSLEIINSAIENLCDYISPQRHDIIKKVKDMAAAAVLVATIMSVVCGLIIFVPKLYNLICQ